MNRALAVMVASLALSACGDEDSGDDETTTPGATGATGASEPLEVPSDPNALEPELGAGDKLCGDLHSGGRFYAFRVFVRGNGSCEQAEALVRAATQDGPPEGWNCDTLREGSSSLTTCSKGKVEVGFNEEGGKPTKSELLR